MEDFRKMIAKAPKAFGVYKFLDCSQRPIYIGKARNLHRRLQQYASKNLHSRARAAISATCSVTWTICQSQAEALLLEAKQIRALQPRYNVLLKDSKSMPAIAIDMRHKFPLMRYHKGKQDRNITYYGPFANAAAVKNIIDTIRKICLLRNCSDNEFKSRKRPCLEYQIKRCTAPCVNYVSAASYNIQILEAREILSGKQSELRSTLLKQMESHVENLEFEKACGIRDRIHALSTIEYNQGIGASENVDIIATTRDGELIAVEICFIRNGQNHGSDTLFMHNAKDCNDSDVMSSFILQFYSNHVPANLILVNHKPSNSKIVLEALYLQHKFKIKLQEPNTSQQKILMDKTTLSATNSLSTRMSKNTLIQNNLNRLYEMFSLKRVPRIIEVFDNSHISGTNSIGVMISAGENGFIKELYRKYCFKETFKPGDDYAMMREMLTRRLLALKKMSDTADIQDKDNHVTDLLLIDGGCGHLSVAQQVMQDVGFYVDFICIAKGRHRNAGNEEFFCHNLPPLRLAKNDPLLYYLQTLRDEAHRFAISNHRKKRNNSHMKSLLDEVPGIGARRKKALLCHFGSIDAIKNASIESIANTPGINAAMSNVIYRFLRCNT